MTMMMFSIPSKFPSKRSLSKFGYTFEDVNNQLKLNLVPTVGKQKSINLMLSSIFKRSKVSPMKRKILVERNKSSDVKRRKVPDLID